MVTAGNLLVEGTINKTFAIYRADNGQKLWEMPVGIVPVAAPITYEVGRQAVHRGQRRLEQRDRLQADQPRWHAVQLRARRG